MKNRDWLIIGLLGAGYLLFFRGSKAQTVDSGGGVGGVVSDVVGAVQDALTNPLDSIASIFSPLNPPAAAAVKAAQKIPNLVAFQPRIQQAISEAAFRAATLRAAVAPTGQTTPQLQRDRLTVALTGGYGGVSQPVLNSAARRTVNMATPAPVNPYRNITYSSVPFSSSAPYTPIPYAVKKLR